MNTSNKFTKIIAVLLCIALLSTMLTGCGRCITDWCRCFDCQSERTTGENSDVFQSMQPFFID